MATATVTVPRPTAAGRTPSVAAMLAGFGLATAVALLAALRLPAETTVLGLAAFGILHNVLELRYVAGRFDRILTGPFVALLVALITGIMLCRLVPAAGWSRPAEILLAYGLLAVACAHGMRRRPGWLAAAAVVLVAAATTSLSYPAYHFVLLAHLHNVVPLLFLWEWARDLPRGRVAFRAAQIGWVLVVPALLLAGAFDGWMAGGAGTVARFVGGTGKLTSAYTPPHWLDTTVALRFLAVFAFLQTMHYVVWVGFLPRYAPAATARFESRVRVLRGWRAWALGAAGAATLAVLFASDYATGKTLYSAVASYHAYLEFPVLLALVLGLEGATR
jgi:hypothetical protein